VDAELEPVLNTLKTLRRHQVHVEIVNLVIPGLNDAPDQLSRMCAWIKDELGPLTPLHFSRFYPLYKMLNHYPTPVSTLERARDIALKAGLQYVYIGNLPGHEAENTFCHHCHKLIIARQGYKIGDIHLKSGNCAYCGGPSREFGKKKCRAGTVRHFSSAAAQRLLGLGDRFFRFDPIPGRHDLSRGID